MPLGNPKLKGYVLGYDLGETVSQISFIELGATDEKGNEQPRTLSVMTGADVYDIPTVLARREEVNQWFFGREAVKRAAEERAVLVDNLIEKAREGKPVKVGNIEYDPISLLSLFIKRSLSLLSMEVDVSNIRGIMFTTAAMDGVMVGVLRKVVRALSLSLKHIYFQSYSESFFHYSLSQDKELRMHTSMALDYHYGELKAYAMRFNNQAGINIATVDINRFSEMEFNIEGLPEDPKNREKALYMLDEQFLYIVEGLIKDKMVSTVYLLGNGYKSGWMHHSLEFLCRNRKVFQGSNLFSKGAAYAASLRLQGRINPEGYLLLDEEKLRYNVGLDIRERGKLHYLDMLEGGRNWFDIKKRVEVVLESGNSFDIQINPLMGEDRRILSFSLNELPVREERTTFLGIEMEMSSKSTLKVSVSDLGFGSYTVSSGFVKTVEYSL